jgi:hypothetical protein
MRIVPSISRAVARRHLYIITLIPAHIVGLPAFGGTYLYQDNFETDAVVSDSWRHSPVVSPPPPVHLGGVLFYGLGALGRGLGFEPGFEVYGEAYLAYAVVPPQGVTTDGSVSFLLLGGGHIDVLGSNNGSTWSALGSVDLPPGSGWQLVGVPLSAGSPAQYLELRGRGMIDDLQISVTYHLPYDPRVPMITQARLTGGGFILRGSNGTPYQEYVVLSTTNVTLPQTQWTRVATNTFDPSGYFDCTNAVAPAAWQGYFRLVMTAP